MAAKRYVSSFLLLLCATVVHCRIVSLPERGLLDFVNPNNTNAGGNIFDPAQISSIASKFPHKMMESGLQAAQQAASQGLATGQQALQSGAGVLGALFNAAINAATSFFNIFTSFIPRSSQQQSSTATQTQ